MASVLLVGGPFAGAVVETTAKALNLTGEGVREGYVARYSATRERNVYRFRGEHIIIATIHRLEKDPA